MAWNDAIVMVGRDGNMNYSDLATQTVPLSYTSGSFKLTNDWLWAQTQTSYKPIWVTRLWNTTTNQLDFTQLILGDEVWIRLNLEVTTSWVNQEFRTFLNAWIWWASYSIYDWNRYFKVAWVKTIWAEIIINMWNADTITRPCEIMFSSDASATIKVIGFYTSVKRR